MDPILEIISHFKDLLLSPICHDMLKNTQDIVYIYFFPVSVIYIEDFVFSVEYFCFICDFIKDIKTNLEPLVFFTLNGFST